ncbi:DUF2461 family protein [Pseudonocardia sp. CA-107938]|uniref:DUF2461 family protein n=1 Tax=Pseudonocardia sp. CA-107938 TaxID=3240021 RepID=UPI003D8BB8AA
MSTATSTVFTGWPADAVAFLSELEADNTAEFWAAQRHRYDTAVRPPTSALAAALGAEFGPVRVFRPYRNRRFRPDVPPYRTDTGGVASTAGGTDRGFVLSGSGLAVTVGRYAFTGPALRAYRAAVAGDAGGELATALAAAAAGGLSLLPAPSAARTPLGYPADHPRVALLRLRALQVGHTWAVGPWLSTHEPLARVAGAWRAAAPLVAWLDAHVPEVG